MGSVLRFDVCRTATARKVMSDLQTEIDDVLTLLDADVDAYKRVRVIYDTMLDIVKQVVPALPDSGLFEFHLVADAFEELKEHGEAYAPIAVGFSDDGRHYDIFVFIDHETEDGDLFLYPQVVLMESEDTAWVMDEKGNKVPFSEEMIDILRARAMHAYLMADVAAKIRGIALFNVASGLLPLNKVKAFYDHYDHLINVAVTASKLVFFATTADLQPVLVANDGTMGFGIAMEEGELVLGLCYLVKDTSAVSDDDDDDEYEDEDPMNSATMVFHKVDTFKDEDEAVKYVVKQLALDIGDTYIFPFSKSRSLYISLDEMPELGNIVDKALKVHKDPDERRILKTLKKDVPYISA